MKYFHQAIETAPSPESDFEFYEDSEDLSSEETDDIVSNHWLNIAIEYFLITAKSNKQVSYTILPQIVMFFEILYFRLSF